MADQPEPTFIYRFFDADGVLLYVGISFDPQTRQEYVAIKSEKPLHNVVHAETNGPFLPQFSGVVRSVDHDELTALLRSGTPLSVAEAEILTGSSRATLTKYLNRGKTTTGMPLRPVVVNGRRWVDPHDLWILVQAYNKVHGANRCTECHQYSVDPYERYRRELQAYKSGALDWLLDGTDDAEAS